LPNLHAWISHVPDYILNKHVTLVIINESLWLTLKKKKRMDAVMDGSQEAEASAPTHMQFSSKNL
jgi:hypothetical protein